MLKLYHIGIYINKRMNSFIYIYFYYAFEFNSFYEHKRVVNGGDYVAEKKEKKLTERQEMFIKEYLIDLNATQAAIRAGYEANSAQEQSSRLLSNVMIKSRVDEEIAKRSRRTGITADRVLRELARIAFANARDVIDFDNGRVRDDATEDDTAAVSIVRVKKTRQGEFESTEYEVRMADKDKALDKLGKHLGMFSGNGQQADNGIIPAILDFLKVSKDEPPNK